MTCNPSYPSMNDFGYFQHQYRPLTPDYIPNTQSISCTQSQYDTAANEWMKFLHGQYSIYQNRHQRTSRCQDAPQSQEKRQVSLCLSKQGHGNQRPRLMRTPSGDLETSPGLGLSYETPEPIESHDYEYSPQIPSRRTGTRSLSISSSSSSTSRSSWSSWSSDSDMETEYETHCQNKLYHRKNKVLPPPTLSPILVPTIPQSTTSAAAAAAFYSVGAGSCDQLSMSSLVDDGSSISSYGSDSDDESLTGSSWLAFDTNRSRESGQDYHDHYNQSDNDGLTSTHSNKYLALSASIWGPGWHQVDPLPPSLTKAMLQNELDAQEKAQAEAQERAAQATSSKAKAKRARQQAKLAAAAAAATTAAADTSVVSEEVSNTVDSSIENTSRLKAPVIASSAKLPRSLQFVD
ncbi:hypothetical protein BGZ49_000559 [Haplosporangium sp. Z 27]|nr:hypothetical protein BGZ49_000559 [Haplosporangium sp. Z 27]